MLQTIKQQLPHVKWHNAQTILSRSMDPQEHGNNLFCLPAGVDGEQQAPAAGTIILPSTAHTWHVRMLLPHLKVTCFCG
jgi:hypothetical protein